MTGAIHSCCFSQCSVETIVGNFETCFTKMVLVSGPVVGGGMGWGNSETFQCRE